MNILGMLVFGICKYWWFIPSCLLAVCTLCMSHGDVLITCDILISRNSYDEWSSSFATNKSIRRSRVLFICLAYIPLIRLVSIYALAISYSLYIKNDNLDLETIRKYKKTNKWLNIE